jgi:cytochrome P450
MAPLKRPQTFLFIQRKDLLELMLSAEMKDEQGNKVRKLSEDEVVAQCFTFILAGYESTSNALAFTSYLLALNPDKQDKLVEEIDSAVDGKVRNVDDQFLSCRLLILLLK